ncbi:MAG: hypothetical protein ACI9W1_002731, partial [Candidatus Azotimanducaceae bacterium]
RVRKRNVFLSERTRRFKGVANAEGKLKSS